MQMTRRGAGLGLVALTLTGCMDAQGALRTAPNRTRFRASPNPAFDTWVAGFRARAATRGIAESTLTAAFRGVGFLPDVIERDRNQTETVRSLEDYLAIAAGDDKVDNGRAMLAQHAALLARIEARYNVEPQVVVAIWGVESRYGTRRGNIPVISALSTLAFDGRRGAFFETQLMAALRILQKGDIAPSGMTGSWAGAMGHTQFIPTSFESTAVDFDGDGRRDIWSDDPTDALASTAAYLNRAGWQHGRLWGIEVVLPQGFDTALAGRATARGTSDWTAQGITAARGAIPDHGPASLILPAGTGGPAFLVFRNFAVIARYNNAEKYVIGVGHLSDRLAGGPALKAGFGADQNGMTQDQRKALQRRLTAAGFDTEGTEGVIGPKTRAAISAYQAKHGLPVTGAPSLDLLRRLG